MGVNNSRTQGSVSWYSFSPKTYDTLTPKYCKFSSNSPVNFFPTFLVLTNFRNQAKTEKIKYMVNNEYNSSNS